MPIVTKYVEPTTHRGSRVTARLNKFTVTLPWDSGLDVFDNHAAAAKALPKKLNWQCRELFGIDLGEGYVFTSPSGVARVKITDD